MSYKTRDLAREKNALLVQDGHREGSITANADRLDLFDDHSLLAHCIELTDGDIAALKRTGAKVAHNPSALMSVYGRCPATELMESGIVVSLGTDAAAPDRSFDMFRNMFQAHRYHAPAFQGRQCPSSGKVARDGDHGWRTSAVDGKRDRIAGAGQACRHHSGQHAPTAPLATCAAVAEARFANGADVDTTIVDGCILMRGRKLVDHDEGAILDRAGRAFGLMMERAGLA